MALFDFFRRRGGKKPQQEPRRGLRGWLSRIFGRREQKQEPEDLSYEEPELMPSDSNGLEFFDFDAISPEQAPAGESDAELLEKYRKMIDTMVKRGYIDSFRNDADAAEFLRVLGSEAWEEAHGYWYSPAALGEIQDAILRGATAGTLQDNYNSQLEKKSNRYLETWEDWLQA